MPLRSSCTHPLIVKTVTVSNILVVLARGGRLVFIRASKMCHICVRRSLHFRVGWRMEQNLTCSERWSSRKDVLAEGRLNTIITKCPYLGILQNRETSFAYPTSVNKCYKISPAGSIDLSFQEEMCLTNHFYACPVYVEASDNTLPEEVLAETSPRINKRVLLFGIPAFVV